MKRILLPRLAASLLPALTLASFGAEPSADPVFVEPELAANPDPSQPLPKPSFHSAASLGVAIDAYDREPSAANRASVKFALEKLNLDIAEQEELMGKTRGVDHAKAAVRLEELKKYRSAQLERLPSNERIVLAPEHRRHLARVSGSGESAKESALRAKDRVVSKAERVGGRAKAGAKEAAYKTKEGVEAIAEKVDTGSKKVGRTIGKGVRKTGAAIERASAPE